jgi:hypothetical protein
VIEANKKLNRKHVPDTRDNNYLIKNLQKMRKAPQITQRFWNDSGWWGNQRNTPHCVGYAWAHWIEDGPVEHAGKAPIVPPVQIYENAQRLDEWEGESYDGTSVRGGVKYLQATGKISSYYWAFDAATVVNTILTLGPVVVGTDWYSAMSRPDRRGYIIPAGKLLGGHAYVLNGVDTVAGYFRIKNSWGRTWGNKGNAKITISAMDRLIRANGEACIAFENQF